ncbi:MAG: LacI family transcriptional regulator [Firmicutes bacterium]|nr:LacI family transcriptional regulator [Bacillota bacterium]
MKIRGYATLKDVAKKAGVSLATASRALNNRGDVDQTTRKKVLEAAKALSYTPNPLARGLLSGTTKTIGILVTTIQNPFYAAVVSGIEKVLAAEGYTIILCNSHEDPEAEREAIRVLLARRVDGLIIAPVQSKPDGLELLFKSNVPFVFVARYMPGVDTDYVVCDDEAVGRLATEHLIDRGHRRILFMNSRGNSSAELRQRGYEQSLAAHGISPEPSLIRTVYYHTQAEEAISAALDEGLDPTAVFCFCDEMAVGVLRVLAARGIRVPEEIAVISCDNLAFSAVLHPPLTTVDIPEFEMGVEAARILLNKIKRRKKKTTQVVFTPKLVERAST